MEDQPVRKDERRALGFWVAVISVALAVRLAALGAWPLGATEATMATRAWQAVLGQNPDPGPGGWLTPWLAGLFFLTGPQDFWARLGPALAGGLLPLTAWAWRDVWGSRRARAVALLWALEPTLVAASRLAWGPTVAMLLLALAAWAYRRGRHGVAGVLALAALAAGPAAGWALLALLALLALRPARAVAPEGRDRLWAGVLALGLLLVVTGGLGYPAGLGGWAGGLVHWLAGWRAVGPRVSVALGLMYAAPLLAWAGVGLLWQAKPWATRRVWLPWAFALALLGLWALYPARQAANLAWLALALAPWAVEPWLQVYGRWPGHWAEWAMAAGLLVFAALAGLTVAAPQAQLLLGPLRWGLAALAVLAMVLLVLVARALFPGRSVPRQGGLLAALAFSLLISGVNLRHAWYAPAAGHGWQRDPVAYDVRALEAGLTFWGNRLARGAAQDLPGAVLADHPTVVWLGVSRFPRLQMRQALMPGEAPLVVLTLAEGPQPDGAAYRGQKYRLTEVDTAPWLTTWFAGPVSRGAAYVVLWVRSDAFAGPVANPGP